MDGGSRPALPELHDVPCAREARAASGSAWRCARGLGFGAYRVACLGVSVWGLRFGALGSG